MASMRFNQPFAASTESPHPPMHVIAGDFNVFPSVTEYFLPNFGWSPPKIAEHISTTVGQNNFDNVLVNASGDQRCYALGSVLKLKSMANSSLGVKGLSDHYPVCLRIEECDLIKR